MERAWIIGLSLVGMLWCAAGCPEDPPGDDDTGDDDAGDDDAGDDDAGDDDSGGGCDRYSTHGNFYVWSDNDNGLAGGFYYDGPSPFLADELMSEGECKFYSWEDVPFCDPPCEAQLVCGFGDECHLSPEAQSVGEVTISDPDGVLVELEETDYHSYLSADALPGLYEPGTALTLSASGGPDIAAFERSVVGVDPWPTGSMTETIVQGQPMVVEWEPGTVPGMQVLLRMRIDHHALLSASVECIADDAAGQVVVPQALVDALIEAGHSGIGTYVENAGLYRFITDVGTHDPGCAGFRSYSYLPLQVETVLAE